MKSHLDSINLFTKGSIAFIELTAPKKLNSLDVDMLKLIRTALMDWQSNDKIKAIVFFSANEKAFCAGGDVKRLVLDIKAQGIEAAHQFFTTEYSTDFLVHKIDKPTLALCSGITMGGGIGLTNGCQFKVLTDKTQMAMPEVSIGLFPDVGASYFLNHLDKEYSRALALSGYRFNSAEAIQIGMADSCIPDSQRYAFIEDLRNLSLSSDQQENIQILQEFIEIRSQPLTDKNIEDEAFLSLKSESEIIGYPSASERVVQAIQFCSEGSPLSRKIISEQMNRGRKQSLRDCFLMEWQLAINCSQYGDFCEGVRAKLIDKTGQPQWMDEGDCKISLEQFFKRSDISIFSDELGKIGL